MPEERARQIHQKVMSTILAILMGICGWYLNSINTSLEDLNREIVSIKLNDSANTIRMSRLEDDVISLKSGEKELSKRVGSIERMAEGHERQLRAK